MNQFIEDIKAFQTKFGFNGPDRPSRLPPFVSHFRSKFMQEELDEYREALSGENPAGCLDALVDLVYVALGTSYMHGYNFEEAWRRVHEANMKKVRASSEKDSKRGSALDIVKPQGWVAPDLSDLVEPSVNDSGIVNQLTNIVRGGL